MPAEVFDQIFRPNFEAYGWPFTVEKTSVANTKWVHLLGKKDINFWQQCEWRLQMLPWQEKLFCEVSWQKVRAVCLHASTGEETSTSGTVNTRQRFWSCVEFVQQNLRLPLPLVCLWTPFGLEIIDGHHRAAALFGLETTLGSPVPIWVGGAPPLLARTLTPASPPSAA